jgi:hypothetical protein
MRFYEAEIEALVAFLEGFHNVANACGQAAIRA